MFEHKSKLIVPIRGSTLSPLTIISVSVGISGLIVLFYSSEIPTGRHGRKMVPYFVKSTCLQNHEQNVYETHEGVSSVFVGILE